MEKAFIISSESEYFKDFIKYKDMIKKQKEFIKKFFTERGIETTRYYLRGNGFVNCAFEEHNKSNIRLKIDATEKDLEKFGKHLGKKDVHGLRQFRKNSKISKEFAQMCIDEKIIINIYEPRISDYFDSLSRGLYGCSYQRIVFENYMYVKVSNDHLKDEDIPKGFTEIKLSEFYTALEERNQSNIK